MQADTPQMPENKGTYRHFYYGLFTLILVICIITGGYIYTASVDKRLVMLETITSSQTSELSEMRERVFTSALQEGRYASLNARIAALNKALISLEGKLTQRISQRLSETPAQGKPAAVSDSPVPTITPAQPANLQRATTPPSGETPGSVTSAGPMSTPGADTGKRTAGQMAEKAAIVAAARRPGPAIASAGPASGSAEKSGGTTGKTVSKMSARQVSPAGQNTAIELPIKPTAAGKQGPWVINLLSSRDKEYAEQYAARARASGFGVEIHNAEVKGRTYWRLQIPGFATLRAARAGAEPAKKKLGIQDVWIHRR